MVHGLETIEKLNRKRECVTHHYACECRERKFARLQTLVDVLFSINLLRERGIASHKIDFQDSEYWLFDQFGEGIFGDSSLDCFLEKLADYDWPKK